MNKKIIGLCAAASLMAGIVLANEYHDLGSGLWSDVANWRDGVVPTGAGGNGTGDADIGRYDAGGSQTLVIDGIAAEAWRVRMGRTGGHVSVINGGSLTTTGDGTGLIVADDIQVGFDDSYPGTGSLTVNGGTVTSGKDIDIGSTGQGTVNLVSGTISSALDTRMSQGANSSSTLIMDGGTFNVGKDFKLEDAGNATVTMNDGFLEITRDLRLGENGVATTSIFNMNGGVVNIGDDLDLANNGGSSLGVFNLNGGEVTTGTVQDGLLQMVDTGAKLNFGGTGGTLVLKGNQVDAVNGYFAAGWITSDLGFIAVDDTSNVGFTTVTASAIPEPATLGLIAIFGGGLLFFRRRFMI